MALFIGWSFRELGSERVQALVHPDNPPSAAALDRLGCKCEGLLRRNRPGNAGREDRVLSAVLRGELVMPSPLFRRRLSAQFHAQRRSRFGGRRLAVAERCSSSK
jgi:hypothetical protein